MPVQLQDRLSAAKDGRKIPWLQPDKECIKTEQPEGPSLPQSPVCQPLLVVVPFLEIETGTYHKCLPMLINNFKIAWRTLTRNKVYSSITILGLAVGLAACMLIVLYLGHEASYDSFHKHADRIGRVQAKLQIGGDSLYLPYLKFTAGPTIGDGEPSVESFLRIREKNPNVVVSNPGVPEATFSENRFLFADSNFFQFFSFPLLRGNKQALLQHPFSIVLSQRAARKYFGNDDPIGRVVRLNHAYDFMVTGISENPPSNSSIDYDFVASLSSLSSIPDEKENITNGEAAFATYFLVKEKKAFSHLAAKLLRSADTKGVRYIILPLTSLHQTADTGSAKYSSTLIAVAILVLLLALVNYMSLSTARSSVRAKEIGVRKVLGANRHAVARQFFVESALYTTIAYTFGYGLCYLFQPAFFGYLQIDISNTFISLPCLFYSFAALFCVTIVLAATYPSVVLSAHKPVSVLYGHIHKHSGALRVRKFFTVFQFSVSVALIICALVVSRQLQFFKHTYTGVDREQVFMLPFSAQVGQHLAALKNELQSLPGVQNFSTALHPMYKGYDIMTTKAEDSRQMLLLPTLLVEPDLPALLHLQWKTKPADPLFYRNPKAVVINETALKKLNLGDDAIGQKIDEQFEVAGVLKDFNFSSLQHKIDALVVFFAHENDTSALWTKNGGCLYGKIQAGASLSLLLRQVKKVFQKYDAQNPFTVSFLDDVFNAQYLAEERVLKLASLFTAFIVLLACMGLFGLSTFVIAQRTKEIGIRKVLGAGVAGIVVLLSKDFLLLVAIAIAIASPIAGYLMENWLQHFAYRTAIPVYVFVLTASAVMLIALFTVCFGAVKVALANPVKSLRTE